MNTEEIIEKAIESNPPFGIGIHYSDPKRYAKDVAETAINLYKEEFDMSLERLLSAEKEYDHSYYVIRAKIEEVNQTLIERACDWIEKNMHDYYDGVDEFAVCNEFLKTDEFIENFKKAMKGE